MKVSRAIAAVVGAVLGVTAAGTALAPTADAAAGIHVSGGRLVEANGSPLVLRGANVAHAWYASNTSQAFGEIKALGANAVRVVLGSGKRWGPTSASEVSTIISQCKANRLICMLEVHDTTGYGEDGAAATLAEAASYWTSIASVLQGQENYVLINIGNEPYGNSGYSAWTSATSSAIRTLRSAGLQHTIVVDAPNWGQDWSFTMRDNASTVAAADASGNTVFSIHMYGVFDTASEVTSYIDAFSSKGLPLIVGEFGYDHSDGNPDESTIFSYTRSKGIGWLAWSWCGNGSGVQYLDMEAGSNCSGSGLTSWGQQVRSNLSGTSEASIYSGQPNTGTTTTSRAVTTTTSTSSSSSGSTGGTAANGYPYCTSGYIDPDGDGWGWQNNASCVVRSSAADPGPAGGSSTTTTRPVSTTTTRPVTTTTRPSTGSGGASCSVSYTVSQWAGGFVANVDLTSSTALNGWNLTWTFGAGQQVTSAWNAAIGVSGDRFTATNAAYNAQVGAGQRVSFGFQGTWTGSNPTPGDFRLNGTPCTS